MDLHFFPCVECWNTVDSRSIYCDWVQRRPLLHPFLPLACVWNTSASFLSAVCANCTYIVTFLRTPAAPPPPQLQSLTQPFPTIMFFIDCRPAACTDVSSLNRINGLTLINTIVCTNIYERNNYHSKCESSNRIQREWALAVWCLFKMHGVPTNSSPSG